MAEHLSSAISVKPVLNVIREAPPRPSGAAGRRIELIRSSAAGERLAEIGSIAMAGQPDPGRAGVFVDPGRRFQTFDGFGAAFTEAAAITFAGLSPMQQEEVIVAYFDAEHGHGYRFCRTHIGSSDFAAGEYSYVESDDPSLGSFSIDHDRLLIVPFIRAADRMADHGLRLLASPWSPPGWMKTNGRMRGGGKLLPEFRAAWARYFCRYIREYEREG